MVFLLYDDEKRLQGFSTLAFFDVKFNNTFVNVLYSGDTIIDKEYWGQHELAISWLHFAGQIKAICETDLYRRYAYREGQDRMMNALIFNHPLTITTG